MTDIQDRLDRLNRRDALSRRARQRSVQPLVGVGDDLAEVIEAVAEVVRRRPGMSVMLAPGDGRQGAAVVRVTERLGEIEVALVNPASGPPPVVPPAATPAPHPVEAPPGPLRPVRGL